MKTFREVFGTAPAISASAPGRVNLLGEHTDYNDGWVLPTAITQRTFAEIAKSSRDSFRLYSADLGEHSEFTLAAAPREHFASYAYGCLREFSAYAGPVRPLDIHLHSTVPIGVGLSSSAALEVAVLRGLRDLLQTPLDDVEIAAMAQRAEVRYAGVNCGIMDQMASSLADQSTMLFLDTRTLERKLVPLPAGAEILVLDSGIQRSLGNTAYNERRDECQHAARLLNVSALRDAALDAITTLPPLLQQRARHVISENERVLRAAGGVNAAAFGELMNASHASLRDDYQVSTAGLDLLVELLQREPAVYGAKLTGAGFGGACVALCEQLTAREVAETVLAAYTRDGGNGRLLVPVNE